MKKDNFIWGVSTLFLIGAVLSLVYSKGKKDAKEQKTTTQNNFSNMSLPRGYRNNNPLNIRISNNAWKGKIPIEQNTDGAFEQFETMAYGFRAALKNIQTYIKRDGLNTIAKITNKWAPASDGNNPTRYANVVSAKTGIDKDAVIASNDKNTLCKVVSAMAYMENGSDPLMEDVYTGWKLL